LAYACLGEVLSRMSRHREAEAASKEAARLDPAFRTRATLAKISRWAAWYDPRSWK